MVSSFVVGILSSLVVAALLDLRARRRFRLRFQSILHLIESLADTITHDGFRFDYVVAVGRNSGVAGSILAGQCGLTAVVSVSTLKHRLPDGSRSIAFDDVSAAILPVMAGRRILVFLCCNDSGSTLEFVVRALEGLPEPPVVRTAALYTTPSPSFMPQYRAVTLEQDSNQSMTKILSGLPWVSAKWLHPLGAERRKPVHT